MRTRLALVAIAVAGVAAPAEARPAGTPVQCLERAGLYDVVKSGSNLWLAYHSRPFFAVTILKEKTPAAARADVRKAPKLVRTASVGRYFVTAPMDVDDRAVMAAVVRCLRAG